MNREQVNANISSMAAEGLLLSLDSLPGWVEASRIRRGLDKTELAKQLGMPRNTLWRFHKGRVVDTVTLRKILTWLRDEDWE